MKNERVLEETIDIKEDGEYYIVYIKSLKVCKHSKKVNTLEGLKRIYGEKGETQHGRK